ncbi:mitochondrial inner membrane protein Mitofilin [Obelidium mucronatum]|nr:mitochondrial inner membrane protein Mitofilin [Obelidium mucronatum]
MLRASLRHRRGFATATPPPPVRSGRRSIVLPAVLASATLAAAYCGLALHAADDDAARRLWLDNAALTGGQRGLDAAQAARDAVRALSPQAVEARAAALRAQAEDAAAQAAKALEAAKTTATDSYNSAADTVAKVQASATATYDSTVATLTNAQKTVETTANTAFETIESIRSSIFGPSATPTPTPTRSAPSLPTPAPKAAPVIVEPKKEKPVEKKKEEPKPVETVAAPIVSETVPIDEVKAAEEISDTPIDFTPIDHHVPAVAPVVAIAAPVAPVESSESALNEKKEAKKEKKDKKEKKEKKEKSTKETTDAAAPVITSILAESAISPNLAAQLESLSKALDAIKPTTKNSAALKEAKDSLLALTKSIPTETSGSSVAGGGISEADVQSALAAQADRFLDTLGKQNETALQALTEQERELAEVFELAMADQAAAYRADKDKALQELQAAKERDFDEALHAALVKESEEIKKEWTAKVKELVDNERDGRLARLDHLAIKLKHLEAISLASGEYVERMQGIQRVLAALQGVALKVEEGGPFKKEFGVLKRFGKGDEVIEAVLATVDSRVVEEGVVSVDELRQDFDNLSTKLRRVQLMPENGGPVSYGVSYLLSYLLISKHGLVAGSDTESILARSKFYLSHGDLESATRELNQLQGWSRVLARDWLKEARAHLEVKQALETVESHIALKNLGSV